MGVNNKIRKVKKEEDQKERQNGESIG